MLEKNEFKQWIEASHAFFLIFEGRYDAYPLAKKWAREWISRKEFVIDGKDAQIIASLVNYFDYDAFRNFRDVLERDDVKWTDLIIKADQQFRLLLEKNLRLGKYTNVGFAIAPFLFTWNFQRFKEYFKQRPDFDLNLYFRQLGTFLESMRSKLELFKQKRLVEEMEIEEDDVKRIFEEINSKLKELGVDTNEPISVAKLLHIFAPSYFPLIDNKIAKATRLLPPKWKTLTSNLYIEWMNILRSWLQNYSEIVEELQNKFDSPILKLVDEGLYIMSTVKLQSRVRALGLMVR